MSEKKELSDKTPEWIAISDFFNMGRIVIYDEIVAIDFYNHASRKHYTFQVAKTIWDNIVADTKHVNIQDNIINDNNRLDGPVEIKP